MRYTETQTERQASQKIWSGDTNALIAHVIGTRRVSMIGRPMNQGPALTKSAITANAPSTSNACREELPVIRWGRQTMLVMGMIETSWEMGGYTSLVEVTMLAYSDLLT